MPIYLFSPNTPKPEMLEHLSYAVTAQFKGKISELHRQDANITFCETLNVDGHETKINHVIPAASIVIVETFLQVYDPWLRAGVEMLLVPYMYHDIDCFGEVLIKYEGFLKITCDENSNIVLIKIQLPKNNVQGKSENNTQAPGEEMPLHQMYEDFIRTACHELRSPLANMQTAIQVLEGVWDWRQVFSPKLIGRTSSSHQIVRYLQILHDECDRAISLLNNLLDLENLDAGVEPLILETINLGTWLRQIVDPFQERACHQRQVLQIELPDPLPPILTDSSILERILAELLNNACKYTPQGERISLKANVDSETIQIRVVNTGVKIPHDELALIFNKFYRIPSLDYWKQGGSGLGLALVQKLTKRLGGDIRVDSVSNETCFTLDLPLIFKEHRSIAAQVRSLESEG